ncbi:UNVERIFIED_CONTAM: hypothetical protein K2H54_061327, partial [Gekko kuhli]
EKYPLVNSSQMLSRGVAKFGEDLLQERLLLELNSGSAEVAHCALVWADLLVFLFPYCLLGGQGGITLAKH